MPRILVASLALLLAGCAGGGMHTGAAGPMDGEADLLKVRTAAESAYAAKDYVEAEKQYTVLARKMPVEADSWFRLGNIYAHTNRPDAAIAAYREALVRQPENRKAWHNMAILQIRSAASSLEHMLEQPGPDDALTPRSREILEQLRAMIGQGAVPAAEVPEAPQPPATPGAGPSTD